MATQDSALVWREFASEMVQEMINAVASSGRSWKASAIHSHSAESQEEAVWVELGFAGSIQGKCRLGFSPADAALLAADLKDGSGDGDGERLAAAFAGIAPQLSRAGEKSYGSFTLSPSPAERPESGALKWLAIQLHDDRLRSIAVVVCAGEDLIETLAKCANQERSEAAGPDSASGDGLPRNLFSEVPNLGLLMDVELDVTLRFGQRHLTLREVLDLASGSVIELDRQVEEPVELILDGKVIARGEAVVIDGNYGFRVTEVPHPISVPQLQI